MKSQDTNENLQPELIHYLWVRRSIGIMGILFPFVLVFGNNLLCSDNHWLESISAYFHTKMQTFFVGVLSVIGILLYTYRGPKGEDSALANWASLFAFGVAFFPTQLPQIKSACFAGLDYDLYYLHLASTIGLFSCFAYFANVVFNKPDEHGFVSEDRKMQMPWFKTSGYIIIACMLGIALGWVLTSIFKISIPFPLTFILEWIALVAFGITWVIKGDWIISGHRSKP